MSLLVAYQLLEVRPVAERGEVVVLLRQLAELLRAADRVTQVLDRVVAAAGERLGAGDVVEDTGVLGVVPQQLAAAVGDLLVLARLEERVQLRPDLPAVRLVRLARLAAEDLTGVDLEAVEGPIRGQVTITPTEGPSFYDRRLEAICDEIAEMNRRRLRAGRAA